MTTGMTSDDGYYLEVSIVNNIWNVADVVEEEETPTVAGDVSITGSGFGTNTATQHFSNDWLNDLTAGDTDPTVTDWSWDDYSISVVDDSTYGKVLYNDAMSNINGLRAYDSGSEIPENTDIFLSWMHNLETDLTDDGSTEFQWKMLRLECTHNYVDGGPETCEFNWIGSVGKMLVTRPEESTSSDNADNNYGQPYPAINEWSRNERIINTGTVGSNDGEYRVSTFPIGSAPSTKDNSALMLYNTTERFRWFEWQNYVGNHNSGTPTSKSHKGRDYYIQIGSRKNVILSDNIDPTLATHTKIQKWSSWADDEVTLSSDDIGLVGVPDGSYYLLVRDGYDTVLGSLAVTVSNEAIV